MDLLSLLAGMKFTMFVMFIQSFFCLLAFIIILKIFLNLLLYFRISRNPPIPTRFVYLQIIPHLLKLKHVLAVDEFSFDY